MVQYLIWDKHPMKLTESRITANHLVVESKPLSLHLDSEFSFRFAIGGGCTWVA